MADHARHAQPAHRLDAVGVKVTVVEIWISQDGRTRDLVEGNVLRREIGCGGDDERPSDALRIANRPRQRLHPAQATAHDSRKALNAEVIGKPRLGVDPVLDRNDGEIRAPWRSGRRVDRRRTGRAEAAAQIVDADDEEARGVDGLARPHHVVPPAFAIGLAGIRAGDVMGGVKRVTDQDRVGPVCIERAVRFVHELEQRQRRA